MELWMIIVTFAVGLTLIWLEFYLPGGVLGLVGGGILVVAIIMVFGNYGYQWGMLSAIGSGIFVWLLVCYWMKTFHRSFLGRKITLNTETGRDETIESLPSLVGKTGVTTSQLSPSGKAKIEGARHDVVAQTGVIESGVEIKVVKVNGISILVQPV